MDGIDPERNNLVESETDVDPDDSVSQTASRTYRRTQSEAAYSQCHPDDSVSQTASRVSKRAQSEAAYSQCMQREIDISTRAAMLVRRHEMERMKIELQMQAEKEEYEAQQRKRLIEERRAELEFQEQQFLIQSELAEAKAITNVYRTYENDSGGITATRRNVTKAFVTNLDEMLYQSGEKMETVSLNKQELVTFKDVSPFSDTASTEFLPLTVSSRQLPPLTASRPPPPLTASRPPPPLTASRPPPQLTASTCSRQLPPLTAGGMPFPVTAGRELHPTNIGREPPLMIEHSMAPPIVDYSVPPVIKVERAPPAITTARLSPPIHSECGPANASMLNNDYIITYNGNDYPPVMMAGAQHTSATLGTQYPSMTIGHQQPSVTIGHQQPQVTTGNQYQQVNASNQHQQVTTGNQHQQVTTGNQYQQVNASNQHQQVTTGNQHQQMTTSNQHQQVTTGNQHPSMITSNCHPSVITNNQHQQVTVGNQHPSMITSNRHPSVTTGNQHPSMINSNHHPSVTTGNQHTSATIGAQHPSMTIGHQQPSVTAVNQHPSVTISNQHPSATIGNQNPTMTAILHNLVDLQRHAQLPQGEIDVFNGTDILKFPTFMKAFQCMIENVTTHSGKRLEMLMKYTAGEAKDLIRECILLESAEEGYQTAINLLKKTYGQSVLLAIKYKERAQSWPTIKAGDNEALRKFCIFLTGLNNAQRSTTELTNIDGFEFVNSLACKLPIALQQQWIRVVGRCREEEQRSPRFEDFERFVSRRSRDVNDPQVTGLGYRMRTENDQKKFRNEKRGNFTTNTKVMATKVTQELRKRDTNTSQASTLTCLHCGDGTRHNIIECRKFSALGCIEKSKICRQKGLCFGCLKHGHRKNKCPKPLKCNKCNKSNPTALHDPSREKHEKSVESTSVMTTTANGDKRIPLMTIVPVLVKLKTCDTCVSTYAFVDNGCGAVFAHKDLATHMNLRTRATKLNIKTLNLEETLNAETTLDQLQVGNLDGSNFVDIHDVYIKDSIPVSEQELLTQQDINKWQHLKGIKLPKLHADGTKPCLPKVTLMIGINVPAATTPLETRVGDLGQPYAVRSPLGWLVYGLIGKGKKMADVHFCKINNIASLQKSNEHLEAQLKGYMNLEFAERLSDSTLLPSVEDRRFIKIMDEKVKLQNGHYVVPLPFRNQTLSMPDNYNQAATYARYLQRRLCKNEDLRKEYTDFMENLENKGYSECVPANELHRDDGHVWYIPHHAVRHPQKKSIRVVFNCPASYGGKSLNSELLQGPDMTNRLYGILLRWRLEQIAVMADIEAMFHQVHVPTDDRDMLRYLWWPSGDLKKDPKVYRMKVHIFGAVSSPSCANYALRRCAIDHACTEEYDQTVANAVLNDFYVDDFVKSMDSEDEAVKLVRKVKELLAEGGFSLKKWVSNSREVIESVSPSDRAKTLKSLDIYQDDLPTERSLGVLWNVEKDEIVFAVKEVDKRPTRRNILSVMSSVYDPIGCTAPYVLKAKTILQACCKHKLSWDETIPEDLQRDWSEWLQDLSKLQRLKMDRCYKPRAFGKIVDTQIHHFADASMDGYGIVTYLRMTSENKEIHCAFVSGKARVAPIKPHTIVKLELTAATSAVRQDTLLKKELNMNIDSTTYWTDSQTVLKYINNQKTRLPVFVANRVAVIHDGSDVKQWRYVPTAVNPADHASRGLSVEQLISKQEWLKGPEFLYKEESEWPSVTTNGELEEDSEDNTEIQVYTVRGAEPVVAGGDARKPQDTVNYLIHYYSDWAKLKNAVAWWLRLKKLLQQKSKNSECNIESHHLTIEDIQEAEEAIIRFVQTQTFPQDINVLQKIKKAEPDQERKKSAKTDNEYEYTVEDGGKVEDGGNEKTKKSVKTDNEYEHTVGDGGNKKMEIRKTSKLLNLNPILRNGLLRVGGRLSNACLSEDTKHPLILPKKHHIVNLIISHIHRKCNHQGRNHTLAELRLKYWVIHAGVAIKSIIRKCVVCRKVNAKANSQMMADLPSNRVRSGEPPFSHTGMDYFGPFHVKQGRSMKKKYGVIFTCMISRAIHIEIASSMDTSSCINALRRFISRRGAVKEITSDNGTNLVGTDQELQRALQELSQEDLHRFSVTKGIKWHFNPPAASHHGGVWERQIRTIRKILQCMLNEQHLKVATSEEQLHTLMCEVEATINGRPLTRSSQDPQDLDVLTPNHLLQLRAPEYLPPGTFNEKDNYVRQRWRQVQYLADVFWKRWVKEYLIMLQKRQKWFQPTRNLQIGDIVLIADNQAPRNSWAMGRVQEVKIGSRGCVRSAVVKTRTTMLKRPITKLCLLLEQEQ